jgi:hypothetical protein
MLDFNTLIKPTLPVRLKDAAKTEIHLLAPTVELIDRLQTFGAEVKAVAAKKDGNTVRKTYELFAEILNFNEEGVAFTAETLRDVYKMEFVDLIVFTSYYFQFIDEIKNAKN